MKTIKYFVILFLFSFVLPSCDDYLKEDTRGRFDESYFLTESGAESYSIGMYAAAHDLINEQIWLFGSAGTDEMTFGGGSSVENVTVYDNSSTYKLSTHKVTQRAWLADYTMINYANYGLANSDKIAFAEQEVKNQFIGECSFFRSWVYWMVVETWGTGAHFTTKPTQDANAEGYQTSIDVFYKLIIEDANNAIAKLKTKPSKVGELTSGVAKAMKARMLMSLAGYDDATIAATGFYKNKNDIYNDAKALADELINSSNVYGYKLQPTFASVFDTNNQNNSEIIWALQMTLDNTYRYLTYNILSKQYVADPLGSLRYTDRQSQSAIAKGIYQSSAWYGRAQGDMMPTYYYITLFDSNDKRAEESFETAWEILCLPNGAQSDLGKPFTNGIIGGPSSDTIIYRPLRVLTQNEADTYKARGIYADGLNFIYDLSKPGCPPFGARSSTQRKFFNSFTKRVDRNQTLAKQDNSGKEIMIFRLAEQYLIAAECAYYLSGSTAAVPYIDALRARARRTLGSLPVNASDINLTYILEERTRELGGECTRWFDIKRTNSWDRILKYNPDCLGFDPAYCKVRPIPEIELNAVSNPDKFKQNPGWN